MTDNFKINSEKQQQQNNFPTSFHLIIFILLCFNYSTKKRKLQAVFSLVRGFVVSETKNRFAVFRRKSARVNAKNASRFSLDCFGSIASLNRCSPRAECALGSIIFVLASLVFLNLNFATVAVIRDTIKGKFENHSVFNTKVRPRTRRTPFSL
jgi:hypothetical protein